MDSPHGAAVRAEGFGLKGPRGWAFRKVDVEAGPGSLIAIEGPSGSGRTCLLLALTGRMKAADGYAEVGGLRLPRKMAAVRRISALGPVPGVSDLDPALTVAEHLRERALMQRRFDGGLRALLRPSGERAAAARARIDEALGRVGLDVDALPKAERTAVRDLERLEALRLSVALSLIGRPRLLAVDDADLKLSEADRAEAWDLLRGITAGGTTVLAVCSEAPRDAVVVRTGAGAPHPAAADEPGGGTADRTPDAPAAKSGNGAEHGGSAEAADAAGAPKPPAAGGGNPREAASGTAGVTDSGAEPAASAKDAGDAGIGPGTAAGTDADADKVTAADSADRTRAHDGGTGATHRTTHDTEEGAADALAETGRA
ncbi:ATP-binding cassette domain-containing protein [Streptomyces marianii]|uniref:ATP-binding cassette domain-containing protein n=1 Tax=Streptomyces marianii TaxID=1817406 RepID=A0A5R9E9D2_9ACTN|nr:ATP-binding cassette domain-containing protein [Streptomyces marianii]